MYIHEQAKGEKAKKKATSKSRLGFWKTKPLKKTSLKFY